MSERRDEGQGTDKGEEWEEGHEEGGEEKGVVLFLSLKPNA